MMSDQQFVDDVRDPADSSPEVVKWRRRGDNLEGLVRREVGGDVELEWVPALRLPPRHEELDDETRLRRAVAAAFEQHGQFHEVVEIDDVGRVALLGQVARDLEQSLGAAVGKAAVPQSDGTVRICLWLTADPLDE